LRNFDFVLLGEDGILFVAPALVVILVVGLHLVLTKTRFGIAMRASVVRPALATVLGVNVQLVYAFSWFTAGALACAVGALYTMWFPGSPDVAFSSVLISGFAGSMLGGLTNIYGAFLGACVMGLAELLGTTFLSETFGVWVIGYRLAIPLTVMVLTLLIMPEGITSVKWRTFVVRFKRNRRS
jgi:branched-chain amino acid transport system permease protein